MESSMTPSSFSRSMSVALTESPFLTLTPPARPSRISLPRTVPVPNGPRSINAKLEPTSMMVPWSTSPILGTSNGCSAISRPISESSTTSSGTAFDVFFSLFTPFFSETSPSSDFSGATLLVSDAFLGGFVAADFLADAFFFGVAFSVFSSETGASSETSGFL